MINSNGFGGNYRYGQRINAANKRLYEIDVAYMKDPKESKSYTRNGSGARYVEGKTNLAVDFRFAYGHQREKYHKHDLGGIAVRRFYNFGPAVILLKPIYYEVSDSPYGGDNLPAQKYNPFWTNKYILSRASFFKGFGEIKFIPGVFAKFGYNFEFGSQDRIIHALEVGAVGELFIKEVQIMNFENPHPNQTKFAQNQRVFLTIFFCYRFGRIVDPYEVKKKRERNKEISY